MINWFSHHLTPKFWALERLSAMQGIRANTMQFIKHIIMSLEMCSALWNKNMQSPLMRWSLSHGEIHVQIWNYSAVSPAKMGWWHAPLGFSVALTSTQLSFTHWLGSTWIRSVWSKTGRLQWTKNLTSLQAHCRYPLKCWSPDEKKTLTLIAGPCLGGLRQILSSLESQEMHPAMLKWSHCHVVQPSSIISMSKPGTQEPGEKGRSQ